VLIQGYIKELLFKHECVTIPNFGAFLTRSISTININNVFYPPRKNVSFNSLLKSNDGILAHFMAQKKKISYEQALRLIEKEVIIWKQRLNTQQLNFPDIGEMRLNQKKKIIFQPYNIINFDFDSFGLKPFKRNPIKDIELENNETKSLNTMEKDDKEKLMFTPDKREKEKSQFFKYAIIGIIAIGLSAGIYYLTDQYVTNERTKAMEVAQKKIKSNVQKANFDLGALSKIDLNFNASPEVIPLKRTYYSVIAGSFRSLKNAEKKLNQLIKDGFEAAFAEINPVGLHRVAYGRFESKREALNLHNYIRYRLEEDAWFLIEK